jgi:hypothetical protein
MRNVHRRHFAFGEVREDETEAFISKSDFAALPEFAAMRVAVSSNFNFHLLATTVFRR